MNTTDNSGRTIGLKTSDNVQNIDFIIIVKDITTFSFEGATPNRHDFGSGAVHNIKGIIKFKDNTDNQQCYDYIKMFWESLDFAKHNDRFDPIQDRQDRLWQPITQVNDFGDLVLKKDYKTGLFGFEFSTNYLPQLPLPTKEQLNKNEVCTINAHLTICKVEVLRDSVDSNGNKIKRSYTHNLPFSEILN